MEKFDYIFTGWYLDEECTMLATNIQMIEDKKVYAGLKKYTPPQALNSSDHFAYIIGYPDVNVKPLGSITRAEVATIFFRLLKPDVIEQYLTNSNSFTDVNEGEWYNIANRMLRI